MPLPLGTQHISSALLAASHREGKLQLSSIISPGQNRSYRKEQSAFLPFNTRQTIAHHTKPGGREMWRPLVPGSALPGSALSSSTFPWPCISSCQRGLQSGFSYSHCICYFFHLLTWNRGFLRSFLNFVLDQGGHCSKWNKVKFSLENDNDAFQLLITAYSARLGSRIFSSYFLLAASF